MKLTYSRPELKMKRNNFVLWPFKYFHSDSSILNYGYIKLCFKEAWFRGRIWPRKSDIHAIIGDFDRAMEKIESRRKNDGTNY